MIYDLKKLLTYQRWYSNITVLKAINKQCSNKEIALLDKEDYNRPKETQRSRRYCLPSSNDFNTKLLLEKSGAFTTPTFYGLYTTIAEYDNKELHKMTNKAEWIINHDKYIKSYDLILDIDADGESNTECLKARDETLKISYYLDDLKVPYALRFSGRGFHIIIPYEALKPLNLSLKMIDPNNIFFYCRTMQEFLKESLSKNIDSTINEPNRLIRLSGTINYGKKVQRLSTFITKAELENFNPKHYEINQYINNDIGTTTYYNNLKKPLNTIMTINNPEGTIDKLHEKLFGDKKHGKKIINRLS